MTRRLRDRKCAPQAVSDVESGVASAGPAVCREGKGRWASQERRTDFQER